MPKVALKHPCRAIRSTSNHPCIPFRRTIHTKLELRSHALRQSQQLAVQKLPASKSWIPFEVPCESELAAAEVQSRVWMLRLVALAQQLIQLQHVANLSRPLLNQHPELVWSWAVLGYEGCGP